MNIGQKISGAALCLLLSAGCANLPAFRSEYDVAIVGGRVIDPESGRDEIVNIGVRNGSIRKISKKELKAERMIDASGDIVAPGFVDLHSHAVSTLAGSRMQILDGVTTQLELENGVLPVSAWYAAIAAEGRPANFGASASWTSARIAAFHDVMLTATGADFISAQGLREWKFDAADAEKRARILAQLEDGLNEGALGVGVNAGYAPGYDADEIAGVHDLAARHGKRPVYYHLRYMGVGDDHSALNGIEEAIGYAEAAKSPVHICHIHSTSTIGARQSLAAIASAKGRGVSITTEAYPYGAGSTVVGAAHLTAPDFPERLGYGPENIVVVKTGKRISSMEELRKLQSEAPGTIIVNHYFDETDAEKSALLDSVLEDDAVMIASDAMPWIGGGGFVTAEWPLPEGAMAHPRSAGSYMRFIRKYVKERETVDLASAIRRMSLDPARLLEASAPQMRKKGRIKKGADADIVIFNLEEASDLATYEAPAQPSSGVDFVIVSGVVVVEDGALNPLASPGRAIRANY